ANTIKDICRRPKDYVFRMGGEEFGVFILSLSKQDSQNIAEQICVAVQDKKIEHSASKVSKYVSISIGIVCSLVEEGLDARSFVHTSDEMLYKAKQNGRNRYEI
ncbi:diguanylate cyclase, partial [Sulfurimonas sp. SAG-AH-194-C21]